MLQLLRVIRILNSDASPSAIATAIALAMVVGLTPLFSLHNLLLILIVLMFRIHLGTFIIGALGFGLLGLLLETALDKLGYWLLNLDVLQALWTSLYNTQFGRLSLFNFTQVMGGLFISIICFLPLWFLSLLIIKKYRQYILAWVKKNKLIEIIRGSALIQLYQRSRGD